MPARRPTKRAKASKGPEQTSASTGNGSAPKETPTPALMIIPLDGDQLGQEIKFYLAHLHEWRDHEGKHVLIKGQEHVGFYRTEEAALEEGFRRFGRVPFLVKQILLDEQPRPLVWTVL